MDSARITSDRSTPGRRRPVRWVTADPPLVAALAIGGIHTVVVSLLPSLRLAYDNPALHLTLETAEGLIAALLAYLAAGRFRSTGRVQHLVMAWAFSVMAVVNLFLSAGPITILGSRPVGAVTWVAIGLRLVAIAFLCVASLTRTRLAPRGRPLMKTLLVMTGAVALTVALAAVVADAWLQDAIDPTRPPTGDQAGAGAHGVVTAVQVVALGLYAAAAAGFTRQSRKEGDELLRWLGAGAALAAFARVHYFLFPSLYSNWVYTGDLLRLGSYLFFLVGGTREISAYWSDQARLSAVEERRRLARDLHDGLTQELAFIRSQTAAMAGGTVIPGMAGHVAAAAERALDESRHAIEALSDDFELPLADKLREAAQDVVTRAGAVVDLDLEPAASVPMTARDALVRVVREATTNAVRHGEARCVVVRVATSDGDVRLTVTDDGRGFDPAQVRAGFGLRSMRQRVEALGGELHVTSTPGSGTTIEVALPLDTR
ncbi:MAG TPA: sensor histidine kinase [Acidimicrobiales bacterium]|nr:sensor histidine kinase [Acidimicrobiales bacterium]